MVKNVVLFVFFLVVAAGAFALGEAVGENRVSQRWRESAERGRVEFDAMRFGRKIDQENVQHLLEQLVNTDKLLKATDDDLRVIAEKVHEMALLLDKPGMEKRREELENEYANKIAELVTKRFPDLFVPNEKMKKNDSEF